MNKLSLLFKEYTFLVLMASVFFVIYYTYIDVPVIHGYIFNPDFLHASFFSDAIFNDINAFKYWFITPSPYIFPDIFIFGFINLLIGDNQVTYVLILLLNFIFFNVALYKLNKLLFKQDAFILFIFNIVLFYFFTKRGYDQHIYLNMLVPVNHLSAFICFALFLRKSIKLDWFLPLWLIGIVLVSFSDPLFAVYFLPVQLLLSFSRKTIYLHIITFLSAFGGVSLYKWAYESSTLRAVNYKSSSLFNDDPFGTLWTIIDYLMTYSYFKYFAILIVISLLSLVFVKGAYRLMIVYVIFGLPLLITTMGFIIGPDTARYITGSLFFGLLVGLTSIFKLVERYIPPINMGNRYVVIFSFCLTIGVYGYQFNKGLFEVKKPAFVSCVESYAKQKNADYVIANYWLAKPLMFFSKELRVAQFAEYMRPYPHEFDTRIYDEIKNDDNLKGILVSSGMIMDSVNLFVNRSIAPAYCEFDSVYTLSRNPMK